MPNVVTQTALVSPTNGTQSYAIQDLEAGKFVLNNGTVSTRVTLTSGAVNIGTVSVPDATADLTAFSVGTSQGNLMMGAYQGTATTVGIGTTGVVQIDTNRNLMINPATLLAGEDLTNNRLMVEQRMSYYNHVGTAGSTSGTVKSGAGFLHSVAFNTHTTGGTYALYDSIGTSATKIATIAGVPNSSIPFNVSFTTGLTVVSGSVCDLTFSYR